MSQLTWNKSRLLLLQLCSVAMVGALFYIVFKPEPDKFRELPNLSSWESIDTDKVKIGYYEIEGKKTQEKGNHNLAMEVILIPILHGDNLEIIRNHPKLQLKPQDLTIVEDKDIGSYGLFTKNNSAHLSTCLHPQGKTAFNRQQFTEVVNHNLAGRIVPWVLGLSDFRDWRCFWVNISVDLENITEEKATNLLQQKLLEVINQSKFK